MAPIMTVDRITKDFTNSEGASIRAIDDISLTIEQGEFVVIVGPSGCGKTTLLRILQGLEAASSGSIESAATQRPAFVFQSPSLMPWRTVAENVSFGLSVGRNKSLVGKSERKARVGDMLRMTGLTEFADYFPNQVSGGMQQRANLGRALALNPPVLLMDEPFSALDAITKERLQRELEKLVAQIGITTVFITHDIREAVYLADRVIVMSPSPGRVLLTMPVDVPRPRGSRFQRSAELAALANEAWEALESGQV